MQNRHSSGMRGFLIVAVGQFVSIVGSAMSQYAITIWSWEFLTKIKPVDDPATAMALVAFFSFAPTVFFSPIAGALVDRWNRKLVMMMVDIAALLAAIVIFLLYTSGQLEVWHLYLTGAFVASFRAFHFPAYSASISLMVPKAQYARADALLGLTESLSTIFAPLIAGVLLGITGITGILIIDIVSFSAALITLSIVYIPQPAVTEAGHEGKGSLLHEAAYGFRYIFRRPSLLGLQLVFFFGNLLGSMTFTLLAPMILSRTNNDNLALASVQSAFGVGAVVGGLTLAWWGGLKRRVHGVLGGWFLTSLFGSIGLGLGQILPVWIVGGFLASLVGVYINASNQAIWQTKVPPDLQGRVFSARLLIAQIVGPIGVLIAGPLADKIFEPAMREGGSLAGTFGGLVGVGPGAGMALILVITGIMAAGVGAGGYLFPAIRNAEDILPDHDAKVAEALEVAAETPVPVT
jgi:MFS family permease